MMIKSILLDTSILVRERVSTDSSHLSTTNAIALLIQNDWSLLLVPQCLIEFWSVATRPAGVRGGLGMSPAMAQAAIEDFLSDRLLLPEPPNLFTFWYALVSKHSVSGKQVWDARLVACMQAYDIPYLLTCNPDDFRRYTEIRSFHPTQINDLLSIS